MKQDRVKIITLSVSDVKKPDKLYSSISAIEILLSLWDTTRLGYVQVGLDSKNIKAILKGSPQQTLQTFVSEQYKEIFTPDGKNLLWVIKDLRINERTTSLTQRAFVYLHADAYVSLGDSLYSYITTLDTVLYRSGMDVTSKHGKNISEAFHLLFIKSFDSVNLNIVSSFTREEIIQQATERFAIPALLDDSLKQGVYLTFEEFKNNNPSVDSFIVQTNKKKITLLSVKPGEAPMPLVKPWGVFYKGELYRYFDNSLIALEKIDHGFIISDYLEAINRRNKAMFMGAFLGGLGGAIIGDAIIATSSKVYEVTGFHYIKGLRPEASAINMKNGKLMF